MESEVTSVTPITPSSRFFSSGTVTRASTSGADSPGASVWIVTVTGKVSGSTSECIPGSQATASAIIPAASATTRSRNRTLAAMTERAISQPAASGVLATTVASTAALIESHSICAPHVPAVDLLSRDRSQRRRQAGSRRARQA